MKIVVRGVRSQTGFGVATIGLVNLLIQAGYNTKFIPVNKSKDGYKDFHDGIAMDASLELLNSLEIDVTDEFVNDSIFIDVGALIYGYSVPKPENIKKYILYTTTETTTINKFYVDRFNEKFDEIWTASKFNKSTYFCSGVTKPIKVLPHAIDVDKFNPTLAPYKIKNKRMFNFIVNIDFSFRKGLHLLIPAFANAFTKNDDVALIIKISDGKFDDPRMPINSLNELLFKLNYDINKNAPILIIPNMIDEKYLPNLYTTGDVYVAPTLGEGFGLPIAESMSCGIPVISSNCSAPSEFVNIDNGYLINLDHNNPVQEITDQSLLSRDPNYKGRYLYNISIESLKEQLLAAYHTPKNKLIEKGLAARQTVIDNLSYKALTPTINELLKEE